MTPGVIRRELRRVLTGVPYNSISHLYRYLASTTPPPRFGAACVWQALELARRLNAAGLGDIRCLRHHRHAAIVATVDRTPFLLDPYLMHLEPLNLTSLAVCRRHCSPAYPICTFPDGTRTASVFEAKYNARRKTVLLKYHRFDATRREFLTQNRFLLQLDRPVGEIPAEAEILPLFFDPEQTTLSIRTIDPWKEEVLQLRYPISQYHGDRYITETRLILTTNDGRVISYDERTPFEAALSGMCSNIDCTRRELVSFVLGGVELYEKHAPQRIVYRAA